MDAGMAAIADMKRDSSRRSRPPPAGQDFQLPAHPYSATAVPSPAPPNSSNHFSTGPASISEPNSIAALMIGSDQPVRTHRRYRLCCSVCPYQLNLALVRRRLPLPTLRISQSLHFRRTQPTSLFLFLPLPSNASISPTNRYLLFPIRRTPASPVS